MTDSNRNCSLYTLDPYKDFSLSFHIPSINCGNCTHWDIHREKCEQEEELKELGGETDE